MDNNNSPILEFPQVPTYQVEWFPVRYEPIRDGGERLTIAIAAVGQDGAVRVVPSFEGRQMQCIFGESARGITEMAQLVITSLELHLRQFKTPKGWTAPIGGFSVDVPRVTYVHVIDEAIVLGAMDTSCLAANNRMIRELDNQDTTAEEETWAHQIRDFAIAMAPGLKDAFGKTFKVRDKSRRTRIDFIGSRLAANFGKVCPHNISYYVDRSRIKLWNLRIMRDHLYSAIKPPRLELILNIPSSDESNAHRAAVKEAIEQIEAEGDLEEIRIRTFKDAGAAAEHILEAEAAA